jgi:F420H(2)-dependent quinone reductase
MDRPAARGHEDGWLAACEPLTSSVLLLTVPGRKTGTPHTTPVSYFEDEGGYGDRRSGTRCQAAVGGRLDFNGRGQCCAVRRWSRRSPGVRPRTGR